MGDGTEVGVRPHVEEKKKLADDRISDEKVEKNEFLGSDEARDNKDEVFEEATGSQNDEQEDLHVEEAPESSKDEQDEVEDFEEAVGDLDETRSNEGGVKEDFKVDYPVNVDQETAGEGETDSVTPQMNGVNGEAGAENSYGQIESSSDVVENTDKANASGSVLAAEDVNMEDGNGHSFSENGIVSPENEEQVGDAISKTVEPEEFGNDGIEVDNSEERVDASSGIQTEQEVEEGEETNKNLSEKGLVPLDNESETKTNGGTGADSRSNIVDASGENSLDDRIELAEVSEETETMIGDEKQEKDDDMTHLVEDVETHGDSSIAVVEEGKDHEEMGMKEMTETQDETVMNNASGENSLDDRIELAEVSEQTETMVGDEEQEKDDDITDLEETRELSEELTKVEETKITETETMIGDEEQEKDDGMTDLAEDVETHGDSSTAVVEEGKDHEEMGMKEMTETQEETVMNKVDETKVAEMSEETETRTEDEDEVHEENDEDMTDVAEDVETRGDSSVADIEEGSENNEEMEVTDLTETQEESVAGTGDDEPEEDEEKTKTAGGKRKREKNAKTVKGTGKKKEEDVCFMCFDGGDLVLCDRRGCPKAYHPSCVGHDEAFFRSKGKWNCGWHQCSKCEKPATYLCYTCMFSLCKGCAKDAAFFCLRGNKGLCETCMGTVKLIERKEQEKKEPAQLDFDDKTSWEYLFKDYWIDLKTQLSLTPEELDQAKSPQKGIESHAGKQGAARETDYGTDGGSDSDSSPKKRKTRSRSKSGSAVKSLSPANKSSSGEIVEWASKELLDVVGHMRRGDRSFLPHSEVHVLLLDYIKRYNLRDPRRKSQVLCDSRLQNLFGKSHVGHFEMLNLLDAHFLKKEQQQADDIQGSIVDTEPDDVDVDENLDHPVKSGKDKKRKARKKGARKGRQSNLDDFAAVDMHNINLIYLRRSLVEDLLEDSTAFEEKVASAFVRLRISGNQKQDLYRLVQVVGTSKAPEPYKVGKKTTDFVLEILNLDKTEVINIDIISNQDFTEDECKRLKQSIKCGLINRLTVGDIQEKAIALQEVRVKNLLDAEILRVGHLRDRASDMGRRKEYPYLLKLMSFFFGSK
ncbi:unnamed protein product [Microthlaspi erraticum]|uniref:PHD-type domain-containing protein n=1 Tax=Microthlaspi erraticum TaxID=1685480 RepID=A0A6D2I3W0_9BRAS|nr:unnamed protein product [Microthlaspi erraticum]